MSTVIRLQGVTKRYPRRPLVLRSVDLAVEPGQTIGLIGANGSGKSTLLRILARLSRPSSGYIHGAPTTGYLPDRFPADQRLSGRSYLRHLARIRGLQDLSVIPELIDRLDLVGGPEVAMRRLSKGNAQKLGVAQAVLGDPRLVVLDEPWSGLDAATHLVLDELIAEAADRGAGIVFADHRRDVVERRADRVLELVDGSLHPLAGPSVRQRIPGDTVTPRVRIVLAGPAAAGLRGHPGVIRAETAGDDIVLLVEPEHSDGILTIALARGCSVREVRAC